MIDTRHVYVEQELAGDGETQDLLQRLGVEQITWIDNAARFFNRPGQEFTVQKRRPRLILARKRGRMLYRGDQRVRSFGAEQDVFYNDPVRNCVYDCDYCFLQGMHRSANILFHVNFNEYLAAVDRHISTHGSLYLSISYLSDLLALERPFGLVRRWIEARRHRETLEIEVRTKSDGYAAIADLEPDPGTILTWSLSPAEIGSCHEHGTATFHQRLFDAARAAQQGWRVRVCFDPVIVDENWRQAYTDAIRELFTRLPAERLEAVSFGVFRMQREFYERLVDDRATGPDAPRWGAEIAAVGPGPASYTEAIRNEVFIALEEQLAGYIDRERIHSVHG